MAIWAPPKDGKKRFESHIWENSPLGITLRHRTSYMHNWWCTCPDRWCYSC